MRNIFEGVTTVMSHFSLKFIFLSISLRNIQILPLMASMRDFFVRQEFRIFLGEIIVTRNYQSTLVIVISRATKEEKGGEPIALSTVKNVSFF